MARPDPDDMRCKNILAGFYGINSADIPKWEITLNNPPAGEHKIGINLITTIQ
jgi:predicted transcriptional regulator